MIFMEVLALGIILFALTIFWMVIDLAEDEFAYEPMDEIEDEEKAVIIFKKIKIK